MAVSCPSCAAENPEGKRFCGDCGQALCPSCGAATEPGKRFCADCGATLTGSAPAGAPATAVPAPAEVSRRVAERRLTTVLFGDLVGFTTISESRDPEDVRDLLSQYFAMANTVIGRYGGTIEKFIGDAVMAVWGVPVAHEDDAERAVRAGLDLVAELAVLADKVGVEGLDMRVGILTGEVAVTLGAVGEGMVAGDAVNTAARIQAAAEPGQVWVDDVTQSLTSSAVTFTDVGEHTLKGKAGPVRLHRAGTIVAAVGGAQRVDGLEAPFTGRDHELRLVKELFHAATDEGRPRLVAVAGLAGVGKTRLAWEFEKYVDGLSEAVWWHRGRVLSYGDGVSFWALAEMVRSRLGVTDGEPSSVVDQKLNVGLEQFVSDPHDREWLRPRVAALLGIDRVGTDGPIGFGREDLFAAWTNFFERVSGGDTCVALVFDDMQHADPDLLDFLDHLLDSARFPLFVLTLARPELSEARPGWATGRRATNVFLEPLGPRAMAGIVDGLVQGLPEQARSALVERSEGVPLYALEMVRALIDRDAVIPREGRYVLAPDADQRVDLTTLDAPMSLQALIAARLDALTPDERRVVQDATVHGLAFSRAGLGAITGVADLDSVLDALVRKEILELHTDRFSPERGQYRFVQALVRTVAYDTLSRRDRKARHLAVADYLVGTDSSDELAAVIARHYLDAVDSGPDDADAGDLVAVALGLLERAARRAESLGSPDEALRHYTAALAREPEGADRARLLLGAARASRSLTRLDESFRHAEQARSSYESLGRPIDAGRAAAFMGAVLCDRGQPRAAIELLTPVYERLDEVTDADEAVLSLGATLARAHFLEDARGAQPYADRALAIAEGRQDWEQVVSLLGRQAVIWAMTERPTGAFALLRAAIDVGRQRHLPQAIILPLSNLGTFMKSRDLDGARAAGREALELTLQVGAREFLASVVINLAITSWVAGDWDEVERLLADHRDDLLTFPGELAMLRAVVTLVRAARGQPVDFELVVADDRARADENWASVTQALAAESVGDTLGAAAAYVLAAEQTFETGGLDDDFGVVWPLAVDSVLAAGQTVEAGRLLRYAADAPAGFVPPLVYAHLLRFRALVGIAETADDAGIDADLEQATQEFRHLGARFYLARTLLERASRVAARGDQDTAGALRQEAERTFVELGAARWVDEVRAVGSLS